MVAPSAFSSGRVLLPAAAELRANQTNARKARRIDPTGRPTLALPSPGPGSATDQYSPGEAWNRNRQQQRVARQIGPPAATTPGYDLTNEDPDYNPEISNRQAAVSQRQADNRSAAVKRSEREYAARQRQQQEVRATNKEISSIGINIFSMAMNVVFSLEQDVGATWSVSGLQRFTQFARTIMPEADDSTPSPWQQALNWFAPKPNISTPGGVLGSVGVFGYVVLGSTAFVVLLSSLLMLLLVAMAAKKATDTAFEQLLLGLSPNLYTIYKTGEAVTTYFSN